MLSNITHTCMGARKWKKSTKFRSDPVIMPVPARSCEYMVKPMTFISMAQINVFLNLNSHSSYPRELFGNWGNT